jgi:molybdate transport system ATP-binding protein
LLFISGYSIPDCSTHSALLEGGRINTGLFNSPLIRPPSLFSGDLLKLLIPEKMVDFKRAIQMNKVNVRYGDKIILHDIDWIVLKGERWNLSGPNGAGKSTLLSLVTADNPQAYANDIYLFDWRRGSGESIWDIKKRIGFVSPELHLYFDFSANCYEVVASGLFDTIGLFRHLNNAQEEIVRTWMKLFNLEAYHGDTLSQLSISIQRVALLARALIKNPPLLILDEPCQGLDEEQTEYFKNLIDQICESFGTTLVYVSHYPQQVPSCVNQCLRLDCGRIVL